MKNEELYIKERIGDKNPFRVPEGYFDNLAAEVMQNLPQQTMPSRMARLRPWLYAAACMVVAIFTTAVFFSANDVSSHQPIAAMTTDTYVEDAADYVMADNMEIYACLSSEY